MKLTREQLAKIIKEEGLRLSESVLDIAKKRRRTLQKGDKGRDVIELQTILSKLGSVVADVLSRKGKLAKGGIDGDYGQATKDAVEQFQLLDGRLAVDGKVGPMTARALLELPLEGEPKAKDKPKAKEPAKPAKPKKKVAAHVAVKKVHPLITTDRRDISSLHPDLASKVQSIIADLKSQGFTGDMEPVFGPIGGFRTAATQDKLFRSGKGLTFVSFSKHNHAEYDEDLGQVIPSSLAADIMPKVMYDAVKPDPETGESRLTGSIPRDKYPEVAKFLAALGKLARKNGLRWLGSPRHAKKPSSGFKKYDYRTGKRLKPKDYASRGFRFDAVHVEIPGSLAKARKNTLLAMARPPADLDADALEMMVTLDPKFRPGADDAGTIAENLVAQKVLEKLLNAPRVTSESIDSLASSDKALLSGDLRGKYNKDVEEVQASLQALGYDVGGDGPDGFYGDGTVRAVRDFLNAVDPEGRTVAKRFQTGNAIGPRTARMILDQLKQKGKSTSGSSKKPSFKKVKLVPQSEKYEKKHAPRISRKLKEIGYDIDERGVFDQVLRNTLESFQKMMGLSSKLSGTKAIGNPQHKPTLDKLYAYKKGSTPKTGVEGRRYFLHGPPKHRAHRFNLLTPEDKELVKISLERYGKDLKKWIAGEGSIGVFTTAGADLEKAGKDSLEYYGGLDPKYRVVDPEKLVTGGEVMVAKCEEDQCSAWVRSQEIDKQGHAWHAHKGAKISAFNRVPSPAEQERLAKIFTAINKDPDPNSESHKAAVKSYVRASIPDQGQFADLKLGDVVGLFYPTSKMHAKAFYEAGTGRANMGKGYAATDLYFRTKDGYEIWNPAMIGQDIEFVVGDDIQSGKGFGMNTHLGFVGAVTDDGHPVVFHNTKGKVKARRVDAMNSEDLAIMWAKTPASLTESSDEMQNKIAMGVIEALLEADMPDDAQDNRQDTEPAYAREIQHTIKVYNKVKKLNLPEEIEKAVVAILRMKEYFAQAVGVSPKQLGMLLNAAIGITGRESDFGQGRYYRATEFIEKFVSKFEYLHGGLIPELDPSIGPAQMRFGKQFGKEGADLKQLGKMFDIVTPEDLSDYTKAVIAACALLAKLYQKAQDLPYDTAKPGVARKAFTSTGNAALDMSIVAYNAGDKHIRHYCGTGSGTRKTKGCSLSSDNYSPNYIPALASKGRGGTLSSLGYVSEVAKNMKKFKKIESLF